MSNEEEPTLPISDSPEQKEIVSMNSIVKYLEYDNSLKSLVVASISDSDDQKKEIERIENMCLENDEFLSKQEKKTVEFCTFRSNHHIAIAMLGHKQGDDFTFEIPGGMIFNCKILKVFTPESN